MTTLTLDRVLRVLQPLVRLLVRNGVTYPVLTVALKRVFLDAARAELIERGMAQTDSAVTLLCGVHRRDVRTLSRATIDTAVQPAPLGLAAQVVARWMNEPAFQDAEGLPRQLPRSGESVSFDSLVVGVSRDVRPRAVLDELLRLGAVREDEGRLCLEGGGFAPHHGPDEMLWLMAANLHDHAAAAVANLHGEQKFLEQAVFVDRLSDKSAVRLHEISKQAWKQAFKQVMREAQIRFDGDAALPAEAPRFRARFGVYFYSEPGGDADELDK